MLNNVLARLAIHYTSTILLFAGLQRLFPELRGYIAEERLRSEQMGKAELEAIASQLDPSSVVVGLEQFAQPATTIPVFAALMTALLLTLPISWVYQWTSPRKQYSQSFAHTLLVIPIAIALVVFLVKGSLALAFGLTGIVAAIRFRSGLSEPMDAVYMFISIGIGLAAGVQLAVVATIASITFIVVVLTAWRINYGARPPLLAGWNLVPADDARAAAAAASGAFNAQLRIDTTRVDAAQKAAVSVLEARAKRWQFFALTENPDGSTTLEFDVRLKDTTDPKELAREIEKAEGYLGRVDFKRLKAKKGKDE